MLGGFGGRHAKLQKGPDLPGFQNLAGLLGIDASEWEISPALRTLNAVIYFSIGKFKQTDKNVPRIFLPTFSVLNSIYHVLLETASACLLSDCLPSVGPASVCLPSVCLPSASAGLVASVSSAAVLAGIFVSSALLVSAGLVVFSDLLASSVLAVSSALPVSAGLAVFSDLLVSAVLVVSSALLVSDGLVAFSDLLASAVLVASSALLVFAGLVASSALLVFAVLVVSSGLVAAVGLVVFVADFAEILAVVDIAVAFVVSALVSVVAVEADSPGHPRFFDFPNSDYHSSSSSSVEVVVEESVHSSSDVHTNYGLCSTPSNLGLHHNKNSGHCYNTSNPGYNFANDTNDLPMDATTNHPKKTNQLICQERHTQSSYQATQ